MNPRYAKGDNHAAERATVDRSAGQVDAFDIWLRQRLTAIFNHAMNEPLSPDLEALLHGDPP